MPTVVNHNKYCMITYLLICSQKCGSQQSQFALYAHCRRDPESVHITIAYPFPENLQEDQSSGQFILFGPDQVVNAFAKRQWNYDNTTSIFSFI